MVSFTSYGFEIPAYYYVHQNLFFTLASVFIFLLTNSPRLFLVSGCYEYTAMNIFFLS